MALYHKYVFDQERRAFVGRFEEMYQAEETEGFDSWRDRDLRPLRKSISLTVLSAYNFPRVLDVGCGKGTFTHLLKKANNEVIGMDGSPTAVRRASESFPDIQFECLDVRDIATLGSGFDLIVVMGTLAYVEHWPALIEVLATMTRALYVAEVIPPNPIGFVKSSSDLIEVVDRLFTITTKILLNDDQCLLFAESRATAP